MSWVLSPEIDASDALAALALVSSVAAIFIGEWRYRTSFRLAWYKEVVDWARACVKAMSVAHEVCSTQLEDPDFASRRRLEVLEQLTSLIDEGRFVFENDRSDGYGAHKSRAYQGYRPDVLNYLVDSYQILKASSVGDQRSCEMLIDLKRDFVSDIQEAIEPNWFSQQARITREEAKAI